MIIKRYDKYFTVKFTKEDWFFYSTYTLIELLKSIPKSDRRYQYTEKKWVVSNTYEYLLEKIQVYTKQEDEEGLKAFTDFLSLFY